jgi:hypothetical protein
MDHITTDNIATIYQNATGLQRLGYWYENEDQMADQARYITNLFMEPNDPDYLRQAENILRLMQHDRTIRRGNAPYFWMDLVDAAIEREEEYMDRYLAEHEGAI